MKSKAESGKISENQSAQQQEGITEDGQVQLFRDNRPESLVQRKLQANMQVTAPAQLKKDAANYVFGDKGEPAGTTATKVITPKNGSKGLFK